MNILMLTARLDRGGAETHVYSLSRELARLGDKITVASHGGELAECLECEGIRHIRVDGRSHPYAIARTRGILRELLEKERFDIIHAHSRVSAFAVCPLAKKYNIPLVTTAHASKRKTPVKGRLTRWGDRTIAVSEDIRQLLVGEYKINGDNISVIGNGIDVEHFRPKPEKRKKGRIVFVSRLDGDCAEAAILLCESAERLCDEGGEIVICGGGDAYESVKRSAENANKTANREIVRLTGALKDTKELLQSADIAVGVSRVAIEAMACGALTVLAGNEGFIGLVDSEERLRVGELTNFCCRGEKGIEKEELCCEIERAANMPDGRGNELRKFCREYAEREHGIEKTAKKTREVYEKTIKKTEKTNGKIVLGGYYGFGNMGDDALLRAAIERARESFRGREIVALTKRPRRDEGAFGISCAARWSPIDVMRELRGADVLVLGGGTLLQDGTSLRSLAYYTALIETAARMGAAVELWGNGLERARSKIAERMIKRALDRARRVGLRDMPSVTEALRLIRAENGDRIYYEPDLAIGQREAERGRVEYLQRELGVHSDRGLERYAVIAPKGDAPSGIAAIFENKLRELSAEGIRFVWLPMLPREDMRICRRLKDRLGGRIAEGASAADAVGLMKGAEVVCGMRLHSLVFAAAADTPFVGFGTDPKLEGFCQEHGGLYFTELY